MLSLIQPLDTDCSLFKSFHKKREGTVNFFLNLHSKNKVTFVKIYS